MRYVTKRNGDLIPFNINKVKKVIQWACDGLDVNPIELESSVDIVFQENIKTTDIQENLIYNAIKLTSAEFPDWRIVAGRLKMMNAWKNAGGFDLVYANFYSFIQAMIKAGHYEEKVLGLYTKEEIDYLETYIDPDRDLDFDIAGVISLFKSYMLPKELPQFSFMTIAMLLASVEKESERIEAAIDFYDKLSNRKISLATPILSNLRKPKGNLSSCFIVKADDDLDSIFDVVTQVARISKNGGGVGVNLAKIRATGSDIQGIEDASGGVIPWIKILNDTAVAVNQLGKRAGAVTVAIEAWHADILEFLDLQTENGDQRRKAFDIFPQVVFPDVIMERIRDNQEFTIACPHEVRNLLGVSLEDTWGDEFRHYYAKVEEAHAEGKMRLSKTINGRDFIKHVIRTNIETGLPYYVFKDAINLVNPNKHEGLIPSVNLCVESFSNVKQGVEAHTCNLVSVNMANIENEFDLESACTAAVRMLDNTIELTTTPIEHSNYHNAKYRTIGVGMMGLADWLARRGMTYDANRKEINELAEDFAFFCTKASVELASERGAYKVFEGSMWDTGERILKFAEKSRDPEAWYMLQESINKFGIRNSQITAIAPNTSSSLVQGCTASILPPFSIFYFDNSSKGANVICPPYLKGNELIYKAYRHMDMHKMADIICDIQHWIDTGISFEPMYDLNNPKNNAKYMYDFIIRMWENGGKTIYYSRFIQQDNSISSKEECVACAG